MQVFTKEGAWGKIVNKSMNPSKRDLNPQLTDRPPRQNLKIRFKLVTDTRNIEEGF